jgi:UDP-glucose 4-epimerase
MNPKKIFISGVAGFIGSQLADSLIKKGYFVKGADNLSSGKIERLNPKIEFYETDINDLETCNRLTKDMDIVIHTAAYAYDSFSNFIPAKIVNNNVGTTTNLLSASLNNRVKRFIHFSSMSRYGLQSSEIYREDMAPNPITPYGIAKFCMDLLVRNLCETNGLSYAICIPHNVYGPRQTYQDPYRNVIAITIHRILKGERPVIFGDGEQKRCFTYINDLVKTLEHFVENPKLCGTFNVGPDEEFISINQLVKTISEVVGTEFNPIYLPPRVNEIVNANCSSDLVSKFCDIGESTSLIEGIKQTVNYIKSQGDLNFTSDFQPEFTSPKYPY